MGPVPRSSAGKRPPRPASNPKLQLVGSMDLAVIQDEVVAGQTNPRFNAMLSMARSRNQDHCARNRLGFMPKKQSDKRQPETDEGFPVLGEVWFPADKTFQKVTYNGEEMEIEIDAFRGPRRSEGWHARLYDCHIKRRRRVFV